jgi:hypothetical protein
VPCLLRPLRQLGDVGDIGDEVRRVDEVRAAGDAVAVGIVLVGEGEDRRVIIGR